MALVNVVNMTVLDNPTSFTSPFQFEVTFECLQQLDDDLEWRVLYVGSAQDSSRDQVLDEILVGPIPVGINKFVLEADAPDPSQLAQDDLLGVTVVLVTCSYREREFVRIGYYVNNEYRDPNAPAVAASDAQPNNQPSSAESSDGAAVPPPQPEIPNPVPIEHIQRQILADKPRVTKFPISWGDEQPSQQQQQQQQQQQAQGTATMLAEASSIDGNAALSMAMTTNLEESSAMTMPPTNPASSMTVTPPVGGMNSTDNAMMMDEDNENDDINLDDDEEDDEEDNDDDLEDDDIINNDDDAGIVSSSGIVSMPEESNISHSYFHNDHSNKSNHSNSGGGAGVQAMAE